MSDDPPRTKYTAPVSDFAADMMALMAEQASLNVEFLKVIGKLRNRDDIDIEQFGKLLEGTAHVLSQMTKIGQRIATVDDPGEH